MGSDHMHSKMTYVWPLAPESSTQGHHLNGSSWRDACCWCMRECVLLNIRWDMLQILRLSRCHATGFLMSLHIVQMQVINAPVLGKVAQTGVERIIGTLVGGTCGYTVFRIGSTFWGPVSDGIMLSIAEMLMAMASVIAAHKLSLDSSAKLSALTFCLVTFGSSSVEGATLLRRLSLYVDCRFAFLSRRRTQVAGRMSDCT